MESKKKLSKRKVRSAIQKAHDEAKDRLEERMNNLGTGRLTTGNVRFTSQDVLDTYSRVIGEELDL